MNEIKLGKKISEGKTVDVYESGDLAVKVFKPDAPKTVVFYEAFMDSKVEETGLNVPKIKEVELIDGKWAIATELIKGKTLAQIMQEEPENCDGYLDDMVELQLEIHSKKVTGISKLKDNLRAEIESLDVIDHIKRYDLLTRLDSTPKHVKLCHGNFSPENIIINEKGTYVVDWVAARQGNASADVGRTYLLLCLHNPDMAEKYLDLFCERTNTSKKYVQEWLPIVAAAQLTEHKAEEKELLMKWVGVVAYE